MVEGARGGGADLLGLLAGEAGQDAQPVHVGVLALAGAHAVGGEALEQLDVVEALLHGVAEILELQVFVEIDEVLAGRVIDDGPGWLGLSASGGRASPMGWPKPAAAAAWLPARVPSATRRASSCTPLTRPQANTPSGSTSGTNCSTFLS
jgi:hypothetical protein